VAQGRTDSKLGARPGQQPRPPRGLEASLAGGQLGSVLGAKATKPPEAKPAAPKARPRAESEAKAAVGLQLLQGCLSSSSTSEAFRGTWYAEDGRSACIFDSVVRMADGQSASITCPSPDQCVLEAQGQACVGRINAQGEIEWEDGDIWMRSPRVITPNTRRVSSVSIVGVESAKPSANSLRPITPNADDVSTLQDMFPSWDRQALADVLTGADGNLESATIVLLQWSGQSVATKVQDAKTFGPTVQKLANPTSPWQNVRILQLKPLPDTSSSPRILARLRYDRIIAARLHSRYGGRQLAQLFKVASVWRRRAAASDGASRPHSGVSHVARQAALDEQSKLLSSDAKVEEGKELLRQRCAFLGLKQVEMKDDGNCQFRAMSQELFGTQQHHARVRAAVVAHMRRREAEYRSLFDDGEWCSYISQMARDGEWGDELTLRAAADAFGVKIHVVTSNNNNWYLVYQADSAAPQPAREVFLTYIAPIHYNTLEPAC